MFGATKRLPAVGALTFSTVITTSVVQALPSNVPIEGRVGKRGRGGQTDICGRIFGHLRQIVAG
jgi:hypothetical protein